MLGKSEALLIIEWVIGGTMHIICICATLAVWLFVSTLLVNRSTYNE